MPRRKQTYEAYGKVWSPVDIPNLEKAIKCLEKINDLSRNFADSLSGSEAISKQINDNFEAREELQKTGIKLNEEQTKQVLKELKARQQNNDELDDANDKLRKNNNLTWGNVGDKAASALYTRYQKNHPQATDVQLNKAATLFVRAGDVMQIAADTLHNSINTIVSVFTSGLEAQRNMYNSTFQNVSVRTGTTRSTYYANQRALPSTLQSQGLYNNVKVSEVMDMWNKLADIGMNQEQMFANALDSVITAKIVPYLDVTSKDVNILNERLDGQFIKQIRGINQASLDLAGNNYMTQELLQTIIDQVQPMSDESLQNLTKGSAEFSALINYLTPKIGATAATETSMQIYKQMNYGDQIVRSGTPYEKYAYFDLLQNHPEWNINDPSTWNDIAISNVEAGMRLTARGPGYTSTASNLYASIYRDALGMSSESHRGYWNLLNEGITEQDMYKHSNISDENWEKYYQNALNDLANDQNQTELTMQETLLENMSTDLAIWAQQSGMFYDVVKGALTSIIGLLGSILVNDVGGNIVSAFKGKGGGTLAGSTLAANIAKNGGLGATTGLGAAGTALAGTAGIAGGIYGIQQGIGDINRGKTARGVGSTVAGGAAVAGGAMLAGGVAASALGIGVANAWNPVGWVLMAAGLIGVAGTAVARAMDTTVDLSQELEAQKQMVVDQVKTENDQLIDSMYEAKEAIKQSTSYEEAKQKALDYGIVTQEQLNSATEKSIDSLLNFADINIEKQKEMNDVAEQTIAAYEDVKNEAKDKAGTSILELVNTAKMGGRSYDDLSEDEKKKINSFMQEYIKANKNSENEDIQWRIKQWGDAFKDDNLTKDDFNKIMNGNNATTSDLLEAWIATDSAAKALSSNENLQNYYGGYYGTMSTDTVQQYILSALNSSSGSDAKTYLKVLKSYGLGWDQLPDATKTSLIEKFGDDVGSYRTGLGYVPYDNYLANLHEGEAVLTASTANELRSLISEYRESRNSQLNFEAIIQTQTETLAAKLDQVISAINDRRMSIASASSYASTMYTNMREIKSLKSFE